MARGVSPVVSRDRNEQRGSSLFYETEDDGSAREGGAGEREARFRCYDEMDRDK